MQQVFLIGDPRELYAMASTPEKAMKLWRDLLAEHTHSRLFIYEYDLAEDGRLYSTARTFHEAEPLLPLTSADRAAIREWQKAYYYFSESSGDD
jgi:hypothetical protein